MNVKKMRENYLLQISILPLKKFIIQCINPVSIKLCSTHS